MWPLTTATPPKPATPSLVLVVPVLLLALFFLKSVARFARTLNTGSTPGCEARAAFSTKFDAAFGGTGAAPSSGGMTAAPTDVPAVVDQFYDLVTSLYELGWGQSFHFNPMIATRSREAEREAVYEGRLAGLLRVGPGQDVLDCGCGVGGPMRTVAAATGAHVTGVTINAYQVRRANQLNKRYGLDGIARAVHANFLELPFPDCSFDAAYAVEATCHAPTLEEVYSEIFRVLKPGATFVSYEWLSTAEFDPSNARHARILAAINYGNGLPSMRSPAEAEAAARAAGFEVELSCDMAAAPGNPRGTWYTRLARLQRTGVMRFNGAMVRVVSALGLAPAGLVPVHDMLVGAAVALVAGGEAGIFTPMHLLVLKKPAGTGAGGGGGGGESGEASRRQRLFSGLAARAKKA